MDRLVQRMIQEIPKAQDFALGIQKLLDQGTPRPVAISMARTAIRLERIRLGKEL